jgi:hypothetical protein
MAVGEDATAAGYPLVAGTGEDGKRKYGAREINRTRDFIAQLRSLIPANKGDGRAKSGISSGAADPSGGDDGDIYFKVV